MSCIPALRALLGPSPGGAQLRLGLPADPPRRSGVRRLVTESARALTVAIQGSRYRKRFQLCWLGNFGCTLKGVLVTESRSLCFFRYLGRRDPVHGLRSSYRRNLQRCQHALAFIHLQRRRRLLGTTAGLYWAWRFLSLSRWTRRGPLLRSAGTARERKAPRSHVCRCTRGVFVDAVRGAA